MWWRDCLSHHHNRCIGNIHGYRTLTGATWTDDQFLGLTYQMSFFFDDHYFAALIAAAPLALSRGLKRVVPITCDFTCLSHLYHALTSAMCPIASFALTTFETLSLAVA
jgi:hypothetical protein